MKMLSERSIIDGHLVVRVCLLLGVVILLVLIVPKYSFAGVVGTLYAVDGAQGNPSTLYTLDPTDGSILSTIDPILNTNGGAQLTHVTGIAIDPTNGQMYGVTNSGASGNNLWSINKATGAATLIGPTNHQIPDISFDPFGNLYGWTENSDDLVTINKSTGQATIVGECTANGLFNECNTFNTGFAIDSNANFYMKNSDVLVRINHVNGAAFSATDLDSSRFDSFAPCNILAFDALDDLFTGRRIVDPDFDCFSGGSIPDNDSTLESVDIIAGTLTQLGTNNISFLSAIEFDRFGLITPPDAADLSLIKVADPINPEVGSNVTFTITVTNDGPDSATGVQVTDLIPSGYDYVSDDGMGAYSSGTGVWTVGTLADQASKSLNITATVLCDGVHSNSAEVTASNEFDPDSIPDDNIPNEDDQDAIDPFNTNPLLDGTIDVIVNGSTRASSSKKNFTVVITNLGLESFFADPSIFDASVNMMEITDCTGKNTSLSPGRSTRFRCTFNPSSLGLMLDDPVEYNAMLNLVGDANLCNNTDTEMRTAS